MGHESPFRELLLRLGLIVVRRAHPFGGVCSTRGSGARDACGAVSAASGRSTCVPGPGGTSPELGAALGGGGDGGGGGVGGFSSSLISISRSSCRRNCDAVRRARPT